MYDYGTGLDLDTFQVTADFSLDGVPAGENLARSFQAQGDGVWELRLAAPVAQLARGKLTIEIKDRQGNTSRVERTFSVNSTVRSGREPACMYTCSPIGTAGSRIDLVRVVGFCYRPAPERHPVIGFFTNLLCPTFRLRCLNDVTRGRPAGCGWQGRLRP